MIKYLTKEDFVLIGFPYIKNALTENEPTADYLSELSGIAELEKVLCFAQQDEYYSTFFEKASYLITSIAGSQYFHNGNKRLAITTLMLFLAKNDIKILNWTEKGYQKILEVTFPLHNWENNGNIQEPHALFLYNLASIIGDRSKWNKSDFSDVRKHVTTMFNYLYEIE